MEILAYKYRLYPTAAQRIALAQHFGCVRKIYNHFLGKHNEAYEATKCSWNRYIFQAQIPDLKNELPYLKAANSQALQSSLLHLDRAFLAFFKKKSGYPSFKSKFYEQAFCVPQNTKVDFQKKLVFLPKFKTGIRCKFHRQFEGKIKSSTVIKTKTGEYYIAIVVERDIVAEIQATIELAKCLGIDVGLESFLTMSNGVKIVNPRWLKQAEKKLKREQRRLSKKVKGSKNREKQRAILAKQHQKVSNQRKDFQHKLSRAIVDDNQVSAIFVEDLNIGGMLKNHCLAKAISSVAWGQFLRFLEYKAQRKGKLFAKIGRFRASTKPCNICGFVNEELTLFDRTWQCPNCLTVHDRDINAAINIRNIGWSTVGTTGIYACGEGTSTFVAPLLKQVPSLKQEARHFNGE